MIERSIAFGADGGLIGTLCLPSALGTDGIGVGQILFNAGVVHRIGPHRLNVKLARSLASRGVASIRFDLSGQGDSARASGNLAFEQQAVIDIRSAMDALEEEANVHRFALLGYCSGGWHSYATALADDRLAGILMYDSYYYLTWRSGLIRRLLSIRRHGWTKAVGGWVGRRVMALLRRIGPRADAAFVERPAQSYGLVQAPPKMEFAAGLRKIHAKGTNVTVMYSGGSRHYTYRDQFQDAFRHTGVTDFVQHDYFPDIGHTPTDLATLSILMKRFEEWTLELDAACRRSATEPLC
ncbi:MAG: alpha/beta fold hydrolase [Betaproteobacteria bacterium]|nr:alpha/beta fold hydrolase [Betaproteobacteria bacterium]